jgi:hypothetical protein
MLGDPRNIWQKTGWVLLQVGAALTALGAIGFALQYLNARWNWYGGQWNNPVPRSDWNFSHLFNDHRIDAVYNLTPCVAILLLAMVAWWIGSMKRRHWYWPTPQTRRRCIALCTIAGAGFLAICIYLILATASIHKESQALQANDPTGVNQVGMVITGMEEIHRNSFASWSLPSTALLAITFGILAACSKPRQSSACDACNHTLTPGQTTCPECGAPQNALPTDTTTPKDVRFPDGPVASPHQPDE